MKNTSLSTGLLLAALVALAFGCDSGSKSPGSDKKTASKEAPAKTGFQDSDLIPVGTSYTKGTEDALVTIVEFSEFQCPFCARVMPTLKQIQDTYGDKVRIVFKHNPLPFHKDAPLAAQAALAAGKQGKFWEMHDKLFDNMRALSADDIKKYATEVGLDMAAFDKDLNDPATKAAVEADMALAGKIGARGTPNFRINGIELSGAQPFDRFKAVIDKELADAEAAVKAGTKITELYAARVKANHKDAPAPQQPPAAGADVYKIMPGTSYARGGKEPLVTIIEFSEFECPFCKRVKPTTAQILETYGDKVRLVYKHNPLPFHKNAVPAAKAAAAAGEQGKFWEMHDKLFQDTKKLQPEDFDTYATELGLDLGRFKADMESPKIKQIIDDDMALAAKFGARGTPNFFVNGRQVTGARPFEAFKTVIDEEVAKAEKLIAAGTPRASIYEKLVEKGLEKAAAPQAPKPPPADNAVYKVPVNPEDMTKGPADALVTIIEFSEFQCPFCSRVNPTMDEITKKYGKDVRIVFKHNPLSFHKEAMPAAQASLAAGRQGKFWEMHDKLFANQRALQPEQLTGYAKELGLDMARFQKDMGDAALEAQIKADQALAASIGAGGTPNFFINGRKLTGAQPLPSFTALIDEELKKAQDLVGKGIKRGDVYNELMKNAVSKPAPSPQARPAEDDSKVYDVSVSPNDYFKGNKGAQITIVEFSEFECPFCSRVNPTIKQVLDTYGDKVKVVFKHNPLSFHKNAELASEAALAAGAQGKFWPMHDLLFANQRALQREDLERYAQEIGLNMDQFRKDLDSGKHKPQIQADVAQARALGASGTPSFFVNGRKIRGAQPFDKFKSVIDEELAKIKK